MDGHQEAEVEILGKKGWCEERRVNFDAKVVAANGANPISYSQAIPAASSAMGTHISLPLWVRFRSSR
jgi:hypothetical protein